MNLHQVQWEQKKGSVAKVLVAKPDGLNSVPGIQEVEGENWVSKRSSDSNRHKVACMHPYKQTIKCD